MLWIDKHLWNNIEFTAILIIIIKSEFLYILKRDCVPCRSLKSDLWFLFWDFWDLNVPLTMMKPFWITESVGFNAVTTAMAITTGPNRVVYDDVIFNAGNR